MHLYNYFTQKDITNPNKYINTTSEFFFYTAQRKTVHEKIIILLTRKLMVYACI